MFVSNKNEISPSPGRFQTSLEIELSRNAGKMSRGDEDWKDFAARSTCAALTHLGEKSQPVVVKIVWRVALIVGIALTAVSSYYSTMSFANLSGSSEMLLERSQTFKMEYPKFHICTSNIFNLTILEGEMICKKTYQTWNWFSCLYPL